MKEPGIKPRLFYFSFHIYNMISLTELLNEIIKKTGSGYAVFSKKKGKNGKRKKLSKSNLSKGQAVKRLKQVEWFKHHPGK